MRIILAVAVVVVGTLVEALAALPPYVRNELTTNPITIGASMSIAGNVLESVGGGSSTNHPPITLSLTGTGSSNIVVNWAALATNNSRYIEVRSTLTANAAIVHTNILDGYYVTVETIQNATGGWLLSTNSAYPHNTRLGDVVTGFFTTTNAGYRDLHRFRGGGTNAQLIGNSTGFSP